MLLRRLLAVPPLVACLSSVITAQAPPAPSVPALGAPAKKIVHVTAERFAFMPSEIVVEEGTLLEIQLRSDDTNHGFRIRGTKTNILIPKRGRGVTSITFDAKAPGRYDFECTKMCGAGHSSMKGAIIVKPRGATPAQGR